MKKVRLSTLTTLRAAVKLSIITGKNKIALSPEKFRDFVHDYSSVATPVNGILKINGIEFYDYSKQPKEEIKTCVNELR